MSGVITLKGLRELRKMKREGYMIPEDYEEMVRDYLKMKINHVRKLEEALKTSREQLREALLLAKELFRGE